MNLEQKIEALLFFKGEQMSLWEIGAALRAEPEDVKEAFAKLKESFVGRGITIVEAGGDQVMLGTPPEMGKFFEELRKEELSKELSKASLETLSIVLYKDGVSKSEINFIRGVNSSFILRALEIRGLVEKSANKEDSRTNIYKPSLELLSYLGVSDIKDLPKYDEVRKSLEDKILNTTHAESNIE